MKTLRFQGYSDDTFACAGPGIDVDCDNCASGKPILMRVDGGGQSAVVVGHYAPYLGTAGWLIGVAPANFGLEEKHIADWNFYIQPSEREYSPCLVLEDAPDDVKVYLIDKSGKRIVTGD